MGNLRRGSLGKVLRFVTLTGSDFFVKDHSWRREYLKNDKKAGKGLLKIGNIALGLTHLGRNALPSFLFGFESVTSFQSIELS